MYSYLKALHIIFVVTWFAGLFYMPRLFIYSTEAADKGEPESSIIRAQLKIMMRRLWYGITWPSAVLTLILGLWVMVTGGWDRHLGDETGRWLAIKLCFVLVLYAYHVSIHAIFRQEQRGEFRYSSGFLRMWNEVATLFLIAIVFLAVVKQGVSVAWGLGGLVAIALLLMAAIRVYKAIRGRDSGPRKD